MNKNSFIRLTIVALVVFLVSCGSPTPEPPADVEIEGQVFIVTQGRINIKLGLVEVRAFEKQSMIDFMDRKKQNASTDIEAYSSRSRQEYSDELDMLRKEYKAAIASWDKNWTSAQLTKNMEDAEKRLKTKEEELIQIIADIDDFVTVNRWFIDLPSPIQVAKTDADGNFVFRFKPGRYALDAEATRKIIDKTEEYYWLIWIDVSDENMNRILLSNDNLVETFCAECVVKREDTIK